MERRPEQLELNAGISPELEQAYQKRFSYCNLRRVIIEYRYRKALEKAFDRLFEKKSIKY